MPGKFTWERDHIKVAGSTYDPPTGNNAAFSGLYVGVKLIDNQPATVDATQYEGAMTKLVQYSKVAALSQAEVDGIINWCGANINPVNLTSPAYVPTPPPTRVGEAVSVNPGTWVAEEIFVAFYVTSNGVKTERLRSQWNGTDNVGYTRQPGDLDLPVHAEVIGRNGPDGDVLETIAVMASAGITTAPPPGFPAPLTDTLWSATAEAWTDSPQGRKSRIDVPIASVTLPANVELHFGRFNGDSGLSGSHDFISAGSRVIPGTPKISGGTNPPNQEAHHFLYYKNTTTGEIVDASINTAQPVPGRKSFMVNFPDGGDGLWLTNRAYAVDAVVFITSGGPNYECAVAHTSGVFATDLAAGKWVLIQTGGTVTPINTNRIPPTGDIHGVVFTLSAVEQAFQYVNGDWGVVGPVTITNDTPVGATVSTAGYIQPVGDNQSCPSGTRIVNGLEVNPVSGNAQGFDQYQVSSGVGGPTYVDTKNKSPSFGSNPNLTVTTGSVVKAISVVGDPHPDLKDPALASSRSSILRYVVLTVVSALPLNGAFRPPISGTDKQSYWNESDIDYNVLKQLAIANLPTFDTLVVATSATFMAWNAYNNDGQQAAQSRQYKTYGRDLGWTIGDALLRLHTAGTPTAKRQLAINVCQIGIEICARLALGGAYPGEGSTITGSRKGAAVHAAVMLNYAPYKTMLPPELNANNEVIGAGSTAEDNQIFKVATAHVGVHPDSVGTAGRAKRFNYSTDDVGFPEWSSPALYIRDTGLNPAIQSTYRPIWATGVYPCVLAMHFLQGGIAVCGHNDLFDYFDRYMYMQAGHDAGTWNFSQTAYWDSELPNNPLQSRHKAAWNSFRVSQSNRPVWIGRPERSHPPTVVKSGNNISYTFNSYQSANGSPITARNLRYRIVGTTTWTVRNGIANSGLIAVSAGQYEVQTQLVNNQGAGPWTVNTPLYGGAADATKFRARVTI